MKKELFRVVQQGDTYAVPSQKAEGGTVQKSNIILRELGGQYADQYVGTMLGTQAQCRFQPGDLVAAVLRFGTHQYQDRVFQDVMITDIVKI